MLYGRLSAGLGPNVRRAAPEIYVSCMVEGSRSMREWVEANFGSNKGSDLWIEVWDRATQIDFQVAQCRTDQELMALLASNDMLEMHMRRLASEKFKKRTGDKSAASQMLALQAPGTAADVAPSWLVRDATEHSKTEHQRGERIDSDRKRHGGSSYDSGGGGRGTQSGQKGKGKEKGRGNGKGKGGASRGRGAGGSGPDTQG